MEKVIVANTLGGEFPLYYNQAGEWSKNPHDLIGNNLAVNTDALYDFFLYRAVVPPHSIYQGVGALFPGEELIQTETGIIKRNPLYQNLSKIKINYRKSLTDFVDELDQLLAEKVKTLVANNKNMAITLSGGVDSAILATYLPKDTICVTWGGWGPGGTDVRYAEMIAQKLGLKNHHVVYFDWKKDVQLYQDALKDSPEPFMFTLGVTFLRMSEFLQTHFKGESYKLVVGQNADTIAGAYKTTLGVWYLSRLARLTKYFPWPKGWLLKHRKYNLLTSANLFKGFGFYHSTGLYPSENLIIPEKYFNNKLIDFAAQIGRPLKRFNDAVLMEELMVEARRAQFAQHILTAKYGASVEALFYDEDVVKLMLSVPFYIRVRRNFGKIILRRLALKRGVPREVVTLKEKKGLSYNYKLFFQENRHLPIWESILKNQVLAAYLDLPAIKVRHEKNYFLLDLLRSLGDYLHVHHFQS